MQSTRLIAFVLLAALAPDPASGQTPSPQSALDAYRRGDFQRSEAQYSELARKSPEDPRLRFNAGAAAYRRNDLTNAAGWFEGVTAAPDLKLQQQAYYNLGNTRYRLGESATDPEARKSHWSHALTNYMSAIKLDGADTNASINYSFVRQQLEQLERQQPPPQSSQSSQSKDNKDNKDKKQQRQEQQDSESSQDQKDQGKQEQQQDNSGSQQQQQQQGSQGSQQPDNGSDQNGEAREKEGANPEDSKEQAEAQKPDKDPSKQGAQPQGPKPGEGPEGQAGQAVEAGEGEEGTMSASQAVQMLESQKGEEKALLLRAYGSGKEAAERASRIRKPW